MKQSKHVKPLWLWLDLFLYLPGSRSKQRCFDRTNDAIELGPSGDRRLAKVEALVWWLKRTYDQQLHFKPTDFYKYVKHVKAWCGVANAIKGRATMYRG